MNILSVSKEKREAVIKLDSSELVMLCNVMYHADKDEYKDRYKDFYRVYNNLMLIRDLSQYGHIDDFCLSRIVECREKMKELENKWEA